MAFAQRSGRGSSGPWFKVLYWEGADPGGIGFAGPGKERASRGPYICSTCRGVARSWCYRLDNLQACVRACGKEGCCFRKEVAEFVCLSPKLAIVYDLPAFYQFMALENTKALTESVVIGTPIRVHRRALTAAESGVTVVEMSAACSTTWDQWLAQFLMHVRHLAITHGGIAVGLILDRHGVELLPLPSENHTGATMLQYPIDQIVLVLGGPAGIEKEIQPRMEQLMYQYLDNVVHIRLPGGLQHSNVVLADLFMTHERNSLLPALERYLLHGPQRYEAWRDAVQSLLNELQSPLVQPEQVTMMLRDLAACQQSRAATGILPGPAGLIPQSGYLGNSAVFGQMPVYQTDASAGQMLYLAPMQMPAHGSVFVPAPSMQASTTLSSVSQPLPVGPLCSSTPWNGINATGAPAAPAPLREACIGDVASEPEALSTQGKSDTEGEPTSEDNAAHAVAQDASTDFPKEKEDAAYVPIQDTGNSTSEDAGLAGQTQGGNLPNVTVGAMESGEAADAIGHAGSASVAAAAAAVGAMESGDIADVIDHAGSGSSSAAAPAAVGAMESRDNQDAIDHAGLVSAAAAADGGAMESGDTVDAIDHGGPASSAAVAAAAVAGREAVAVAHARTSKDEHLAIEASGSSAVVRSGWKADNEQSDQPAEGAATLQDADWPALGSCTVRRGRKR